jgi:lipopolysaccharide transport system ATP-binding protein
MSFEAMASSSMETMIQVQGVGKTYRMYNKPSDRLWQHLWPSKKAWFKDFVALEGVSLEIKRGEVFGIVGVNGAGKSTLLQLVTGTITPTQGSVQTHGRVAAILELGSGFNPEFTGRENIYLNAATLGLNKAEIEDRIDSIIEFASIGLHIDQPVKTYSSGMVVRLAFSIATSVDADILIIDEALSVGDGSFRRRSFDRIMQIKESGKTILFCSHVLFHVEAFCDRALWLHRGQVQKLGSVSEVLRPFEEFLDTYEKDGSPLPDSSELIKSNELPSDSVETFPQGDARMVCVEVRLDGHLGTELSGVSLSSKLDVQIEFISDPSIPAPSAALVFSSENGKILGSCLSHSQAFTFDRDSSGQGVAHISIDRIPLNKGRYRIGVYLFCENGIHGYAMADPVAHMTLHHHGLETGAWLIDGMWDNLKANVVGTSQ